MDSRYHDSICRTKPAFVAYEDGESSAKIILVILMHVAKSSSSIYYPQAHNSRLKILKGLEVLLTI